MLTHFHVHVKRSKYLNPNNSANIRIIRCEWEITFGKYYNYKAPNVNGLPAFDL